MRWGIPLIGLAAATYLVAPPSWPAIVLAVGAWAALARDRRFGALPAAVAIVLALPYDRAADIDLLRLASIPVRPHDVVIGLALIASLPNLRRLRMTTGAWLLAAFVAIGIGALVLGLINGQALRDILRDARWWGLYAGGLLLAGAPPKPARLIRGAFTGLSVYCLLLIITALLPGIEGGLKLRAMAFDVGVLRLHFGPTAFLLLPVAFWSVRMVMDRRWLPAALGLGLAAAGIGLSVTRVTSVVMVVVVVLAALAAALTARPVRWRALASPILGSAAALVVALAINTVGVQIPPVADLIVGRDSLDGALAEPSLPTPEETATASTDVSGPTPAPTPAGPLTRFTLDLGRLLLAVTDRFESYRNAVELIGESPVIGHGMGVLVDVEHEFGAGEFDTPGRLPNVDNAYLTMAMKAGIVGVVAFVALVVWPIWRLARHTSKRASRWLLPAWLGLLLLTMTQGFAVIGHSPFVLGLLIVTIDAYPRRPQRSVPQGNRAQASAQMSRSVSESS